MAQEAVDKASLGRFLASEAPFLLLGQLGPGARAVTNELKMNFLRSATGGDVIATARVLRMGKRIAYGEVHLAVADHPERLIAHATSSYALLSSLGGEREKGGEA